MQTYSVARRALPGLAMAFICLFVAVSTLYSASIVEFNAVGKVESIYRDRITMRILQVLGSDTVPLEIGSWVSFDLPKQMRDKNSRRNRGAVSFGDVVEAQLIGNIATEYAVDEDGQKNEAAKASVPSVLLWTAQSVTKVKKPDQYLPETERKSSRKKDRRRKKDKEPKEEAPTKIWTQEETVRGDILVKKDVVYIKEDRLGRKDKGLHIVSEEWLEKLKELEGTRVVLHGTTHRTSVSSGTMELKNIMRVYPK